MSELHNRVIEAAMKRALELEDRLANVLRPILAKAGTEAAQHFAAKAVDHLTAALDQADRDALRRYIAAGGVAADVGKSITLRASADIAPTSTMIALVPRAAESEQIAQGGDPNVMHVTLAYLGQYDGDLSRIVSALSKVAAGHAPLAGQVGGVGHFADNGSGHPAILLPSVPGLVELRVAVTEALVDAGFDYGRDHGYLPHATVRYDPNPSVPDAEAIGTPLHFDSVWVVRGDVERHEVPLTGVRPLTASGEAGWTSPSVDELFDMDAFVAAIRAKTDPVRAAVINTMFSTVSSQVNSKSGGNYTRPPGLAVSKSSEIKSSADLADFARMPPATDGAYDYFTHAVRSADSIDAILKGGIQAGKAGQVFGSAPPLVRDLGHGYVVFRAPAGTAKAGTDFIEQGLSYPEYTVESVKAEDIVKTVRVVTDETGFKIREDELAQNILAGKVKPEELESLPSRYQHWGSLPSATAISFDVTNPFVQQLLSTAGQHIVSISDTTRVEIQKIIDASYQNGLSIPNTAKAIRAGMKEASPARARTIARTELVGGVNGGSLAAVQIVGGSTGTGYSKVWMTAWGAKHPRHYKYVGLDGQTVGLDEYFDVGGSSMQFPGDPNGAAHEVINCRCTMRYEEQAATPETR